MKKIITLLAVIGMFGFQGCTSEEDNDTISSVVEISEVSFSSANNFSIIKSFSNPISLSDIVLVYRLSGVSQGEDVWSLLPETHYFNDGTLDFSYDFDFTRYDVNIFMVGNDLTTVSDQFRLNQIFRIVIVPAYSINAIDKNNYKEVVNSLNINESQIQKIDL